MLVMKRWSRPSLLVAVHSAMPNSIDRALPGGRWGQEAGVRTDSRRATPPLQPQSRPIPSSLHDLYCCSPAPYAPNDQIKPAGIFYNTCHRGHSLQLSTSHLIYLLQVRKIRIRHAANRPTNVIYEAPSDARS